jgi:dTDP-glucose 4,6-dehydratase
MKTWLITGAAGFIGSNFVRQALIRVPYNLVLLDSLTYAGNLANLTDALTSDRVTFVKADITDVSAVQRVFGEFDIHGVIHFAAESHVDRSILGAAEFIRTNVVGTQVLLDAARNSWVAKPKARFLHVSTDEVFGDLGPEDAPFDERSPYRPSSPYAASKAASDHLVRAWHRTYGLPVIVSNCTNNFGPWQFPEKLIPLMILNALEGRPLPMYGDGLNVRDWLHVDDHADALLILMEGGVIGETYCVGGGNELTNRDVITAICDVVDVRLNRAPGSTAALITPVSDRPGHDRRYAMNADKLRAELGWQPRQSLIESLPHLVDWYIANKNWADSIRSGSYRSFYAQQYGRLGA